MKKIIASAVGLMMAGGVFATTAQADFENQFGGYWRTRVPFQYNFKAKPGETFHRVDTRSKIYYTAKFSDSFKFVNRFRFQGAWGDADYDLGFHPVNISVEHTYIDATVNDSLRFKVGAQPGWYGRGLLFDDIASGVMAIGTFGNVVVDASLFFPKNEDAGMNTDETFGIVNAKIMAGDAMTVTPYVMYVNESAGSTEEAMADGTMGTVATGDVERFYLGADVDVKLDAVSIYGTGIFEKSSVMDADNDGYLLLGGVDAGIAHGKALYASGGEDAYDGYSIWYTTSEIVGAGVLNNTTSAGGPGAAPTNYVAFNGGVTIKPMEKFTLKGDVWYMMLAEDDEMGNNELGLEFDGVLTYKVYDMMNIDLVLAYLVAGDATNYATGNDDDLWEAGAQLSFSF